MCFVGYPQKLYDIESKPFFILRDVMFHEHIFPFQSAPPTNDCIDSFPDTILPKFCQALPPDHPHTNSSYVVDHNDTHNDSGSLFYSWPDTSLPPESNFV